MTNPSMCISVFLLRSLSGRTLSLTVSLCSVGDGGTRERTLGHVHVTRSLTVGKMPSIPVFVLSFLIKCDYSKCTSNAANFHCWFSKWPT